MFVGSLAAWQSLSDLMAFSTLARMPAWTHNANVTTGPGIFRQSILGVMVNGATVHVDSRLAQEARMILPATEMPKGSHHGRASRTCPGQTFAPSIYTYAGAFS